MKILYVSNGSNFAGAGGMEYHLIDVTTWLEEKGAQTTMAIRKDTFLHNVLLKDRQNVIPLSWSGFHKVFSFFQLWKVLAVFSPDIISINRERDIRRIFSIVKFIGLFLKKKPKIVSVFHNIGWRSSFRLEKLDGIIFPNKHIRDDYIPSNPGAELKSTVIYHGIHLPGIDKAEKLNACREKKFFKGIKFPLIGMIGELRKNQSELIEVAYYLKKKCRSFTIAIVGRGSDDEIRSLKRKIDHMGLSDNFIVTGGVDRKFMEDIYFDLDYSVTTNRVEPFGLVFIESLASYTPLIAYNSGGPVEILEKGGGILVHGGPEEMAEAISALISDVALRRSMAIAGREVAEKYFSINTMGEAHYHFYQVVMKSRS